jgi:hypothetical protein
MLNYKNYQLKKREKNERNPRKSRLTTPKSKKTIPNSQPDRLIYKYGRREGFYSTLRSS